MSDFKSQVELLQWLIDGGMARFYGRFYFVKDSSFKVSSSSTGGGFLCNSVNDFYHWDKFKKITPWYDSLAPSDKNTWKLCKVWDDGVWKGMVAVINKRPDRLFYDVLGMSWQNAEPITQEQFQNPALLYGDEE